MKKKEKRIIYLIVDVLLAGLLVYGTYLEEYRVRKELPSLNQAVASAKNTEGKTEDLQENAASLQEEPLTADWHGKYSEYFTEQTEVMDHGYSSPNISVQVDKVEQGTGADTITYYVADIHIASLNCLRSGFADGTYGLGYCDTLQDLDKGAGDVLTVNGDSYSNDHLYDSGTVVRNGILYRQENTKYDVCVLYSDGSMKTFAGVDFQPQQEMKKGVWQVWIFGPALLDENGKAKKTDEDFNTWRYVKGTHPRTAIGYYEPGHYCMVVVDGRQEEKEYSRGMDLEELSLVFENLGCSVAYNLDGGHCSAMFLNGKPESHPFQNSDDISDCIYICEP